MSRRSNNASRKLILIMTLVSLSGLAFAWYYYSTKNTAVDPRVKPARILYKKYNGFASSGAYDSVFSLMDSIEKIYSNLPHYQKGFEVAVLYNNRSAACLGIMMEATERGRIEDSSFYLNLAEKYIRKSIRIYENWEANYSKVFPDPGTEFKNTFMEGLDAYSPEEKQEFYTTRLNELENALEEYPRRLSVSLTNLGIIKRYQEDYDSSAVCFVKAIELWDRNLTAENNLNVLLNKPLKKRNLIQKLFPPEK